MSTAGPASGGSSPLERIPDRVRRAVRDRVGVDPRALAAFRIAVGSLLLLDLLLRTRNFRAFYTDAGVLPRGALAEGYPTFARISLHALSGSAWFQALLFALAAVAALSLAAGYRTRVAAVASFVLLASLQFRNPLVLNGGDALFVRLTLWGALLPLGERWSVDAVRRGHTSNGSDRRPRDWVVGFATVGLLCQVVVVYVANVGFKLRGDLWVSGEAIRYVFSLESFTWLAGEYLAEVPWLLVTLDRAWLALLLASPLLILTTGWRRGALATAFVGAHLGLLATLKLGIFPLVSVAALLPFYPSAVWDWVAARIPDWTAEEATDDDADGPANWVGGAIDRSPRIVPDLPRVGAPFSSDRLGTVRRRFPEGIAAVLLAVLLVWNAATLGVVDLPGSVTEAVDPEERRWDMFAPEPLRTDSWYVAPGRLTSGGEVDAFDGSPVEWDRPPTAYPTARWRKYLGNLRDSDNAGFRDDLARYLCRSHNRAHDDDLVSVRVVVVEQPSRLSGPEPTRRVTVADRECRPDPT